MSASEGIIFTMFLVFAGAAILATVALFARQAMILAYIAMGAIAGPAGFGLASDPEVIAGIAEIGIMFLLYLLGLNLYPQKLLEMIRQATALTLISSVSFAVLGILVAVAFGVGVVDALVVGAAMMFSSTILGLKLLPTTALHHRHAGEIMISVLLIQDIIAIICLLMLGSIGDDMTQALLRVLLGLPALVLVGLAGERYLLRRLLMKFDGIQEYVFLLAIGWCLGLAQLAHAIGLSFEIGAFVAGVSLAASPISRYIAESLKPIRDFFLVIFFFTLGAGLDPDMVERVALPAFVLASVMLIAKPLIFWKLLAWQGESTKLAREMGARLGQISEFSLLIATVALANKVVEPETGYLIQIATLISFIASSYFIVMFLPSPMGVSERLRQD